LHERKGHQYHITDDASKESFDEAYVSENDKYINTLTAEQQSRYLIALYGKQEATYQEFQTSSYPGAEEGCISSISGQVNPTLQAIHEIQDKLTNSGNSDSLFSNTDVLSANIKWSNCMAEKMLFFTTPQEFYVNLQELTDSDDLKQTTESVQISLYCKEVSGLDAEMKKASEAFK